MGAWNEAVTGWELGTRLVTGWELGMRLRLGGSLE